MFKVNTVIVTLCLAESLSISVSLGSDDVENNILAFLSSECISQKDGTSLALYISAVRSLWTCRILLVLSIKVHRPCCISDFILFL